MVISNTPLQIHTVRSASHRNAWFPYAGLKLKAYAVILQTIYEMFMNEIRARGRKGLGFLTSSAPQTDERLAAMQLPARPARSIACTLTHPKHHAQAGSVKSGDQAIDVQ
jgi:hypothetical protein